LPLRVVVDPGPGSAASARNHGVAATRCRDVLFVDADDTVSNGYVAAMRRALQGNELVCARMDRARLNPRWLVERTATHPQERGQLIVHEFRHLPFAGAGTLGIRRSRFLALGGFSTELRCYEEADLCWRAQAAGVGSPVMVPEAVLHYRLRSSTEQVWRRAKSYGEAQAVLYALHGRYGMPARARHRALAGWLRTLGEAAVLWPDPGRRQRAVWELAVRAGRLSGSLQHGVRYP
jgi:GT2 family glycosyltransferase